MDLHLTGKRALVTGGSSGLGRAIARQLAVEGARVTIAARDGQRLAVAAKELGEETGAAILTATVDTSNDASVKALIETVVAGMGGLDILVNAAAKPGSPAAVPGLAGLTEEAFWEDMNVKVLGYLRTIRAAVPHMTAKGWGRVINISGLAARQTGSIVGSVRNVAVAALTKNLADELGPKGVNVTVVHPAYTRTERTQARLAQIAARDGISIEEAERRMGANTSIGRIIDATEVADVVAFLASPRSVAITGDAIACGGGARGAIYY
jgi:NAD(P)-dependent dehydrogenase (short-subunit alcohol dehydrogenase family)